MSDRPVVLLADLSSWDGWLHLSAALRRQGFETVRLTGSAGTAGQRMRVSLERLVFSRTHQVLRVADGKPDVSPILPWLSRLTDIQMVDAIGSVLTRTEAWKQATHLHRVHAADLAESVVYDKWAYSAIAADNGVPIPRSMLIGDAMPPGRWILKGRAGSGGDRVAIVEGLADVRGRLAQWGVTAEEAFLQEMIDGEVWNVGGVAHDGDVLVAAPYRAMTSPLDPQGPPVDIQIADRPDQVQATRALLQALRYTGPFAVDFIDDGTPYLLDLNPRFFGTWAAMQAAGVDLLGAYLSTLGRPWQPRRSTIRKDVLPASAVVAGQSGSPWRRARQFTSEIGPVVGPVASAVITVEAAAETRPQSAPRRSPRTVQPQVAIAYTQPWLAALHWGAALRERDVFVRRFTVSPTTALQRARQKAESVCFDQTVYDLREDDDEVTIRDPQRLVADVLDIQMTEGVLAAMLPTEVWRAHPGLHRVGPEMDQRLLCDKGLLMRWAVDRAIPVPHTWAAAQPPMSWPVIAKPATGYGGVGVEVLRSAEEFTAASQAWSDPMVVQEFLPGPQVNVGGVAHCGQVMAAACYEPLPARDNPKGPAVAIRIVDRPDVLALAARLVAALDYSGPFCVDLVRDAHGEFKVVDFNARIFGSWTGLQRAGLDIVGAYLELIGLQDAQGASKARVGAEFAVDIDPSMPLISSLRAVMKDLRPITGLPGLIGQGVQSAAKKANS